jgi:chemotaxis-related protein WspB
MLGLFFQVGPERVAVDVRRVHEVVPRVRLSIVQGAPAWLSGVFVYHGQIVPVIDLHALAKVGACPPHLSSRIILFPNPTEGPDSLVGVLATQVAELKEIDAAGARLLPGPRKHPVLGPAVADGEGVLRLLDPDAVLALVAGGAAGALEVEPHP